MNILVVAPHPDDELVGCGGAIARHVALGDTVHVPVVTRGDAEIFPPAVIEKTRGELGRAHASLGIAGVEFLDFPVPKLDVTPGYRITDSIAKTVRRLMPQTLYLPHRGDLHSDHRKVCDAALVAARPIIGCRVKTILCHETVSETEWIYPFGAECALASVDRGASARARLRNQCLSRGRVCFGFGKSWDNRGQGQGKGHLQRGLRLPVASVQRPADRVATPSDVTPHHDEGRSAR